MSEQLILFDNVGRDGICWSPNVWKSRLLLNYKGIDYKTEWLEGPMIAPTLWNLDVEPNKLGTAMAPYTIPAVMFPGNHCIMESSNVAREIERLYPQPSARVDHEMQARVQVVWTRAIKSYAAILVPRMPDYCLTESTAEWHRAIRTKTYKMSLQEYAEKEGGEKCWQKTVPLLQDLAAILKENEGPFCLPEVSYSDFLIVAFLEYCRVLKGDCLERVYAIDPVFERLYDACKPWLARNDH